MKAALLPDRSVIKLVGDSARNFLHGLVTADILELTPGVARFCALLTPQGKIIADFFVVQEAADGGFYLDIPRAQSAAVVEKLNLYKLRAKVGIENHTETYAVLAAWSAGPHVAPAPQAPETGEAVGLTYQDPRLPALGTRVILSPSLVAAALAQFGATLVDASDYEAHRIALGVPKGGTDFSYGDAFPHESDMDQLGGVDFTKGCYVGQEVVSRMEHRGTARTRAVPISYDEVAPRAGAPVTAGERQLGVMGSAAAGRGLALLRLDRVAEAIAAGVPLSAGGVPIDLVKPEWAHFAFPGENKAAE